jgi:hypothetical protein
MNQSVENQVRNNIAGCVRQIEQSTQLTGQKIDELIEWLQVYKARWVEVEQSAKKIDLSNVTKVGDTDGRI